MTKNKLIIAAAGSGKTTHLVEEALKRKGKVLITTFTESNEEEIKKKFLEKGKIIPSNITIQTWFSFLLQHGVKPYQGGFFEEDINGLLLSNEKTGVKFINKEGIKICYPEKDVKNHFFSKGCKIYSDKLSKFVIRCNHDNKVIDRISKIYESIFIDEVQDLAGYDLDILKLFLKSFSEIILVGDPRQVTYLTHLEGKYRKYRNGLIKDFILNECDKNICEIDEISLNKSYRNNIQICKFSSRLYPDFEEPNSEEKMSTGHDGIFLIKESDIEEYCNKYKPQKLHYSQSEFPDLNFGISKGLGFERILIYPTDNIKKYLREGNLSEIESIRAKFYVALTRARFSVGIVLNYDDYDYIEGVQKYNYKKPITLSDFGI